MTELVEASSGRPRAPLTDHQRGLLHARLAGARKAAARAGAGSIPRQSTPEGPRPLSRAQARLWFLNELEPDGAAYHMPVVLRLTGELDADALRLAVWELADRHQVLRSRIVDLDGEPVAVLCDAHTIPFTAVDLADPGTLTQAMLASRQRPFRLAEEPPVRAELYRLGGQEHVLFLTVHHIAFDAWSYDLAVAELGRLYAGQVARSAPAAAPALQYADFAHWQAGREASEAELQWWVEALSGLAPVLELPTDHPRPSVADWSAGSVPLTLPGELSARLAELAAATGTTVFMVLLAAWQALLARVCGTSDVPVGVPTAGRHHPDLEQMIGCFISTLVMRTDLSGDPTGRELLARVRETALEAMAHGEVPFERIVDRLQPERSLATTPIFQVLLNVLENPSPELDFPGVVAEYGELPLTKTKYDLNLALYKVDGGGYEGSLLYREDLFEARTAQRLAGWFQALLTGLAEQPDLPVGALPLEPGEQPTLVGPEAVAAPELPLHRLISRWAGQTPQATAVVAPDGSLTYAELVNRAGAVATRLLELGLRAEEPVAVFMDRCAALPVAILGSLQAGGVYLPLDPSYPDGRVAEILDSAGARVVLTEASLVSRLQGRQAIVVADLPEPGTAPTLPEIGLDRLAYLIFTSGSTGKPKGVAVEHRNIAHYLAAVERRIGRHSSYALVSTHAADLGMTNLFGGLTSGATVHLVDREVATDPEAFAAYLAAHPVDAIKLVPSHLELLGAHADLASVLPRKLVVLAGEGCPWELVSRIERARPDLEIQVHYGPTETTVSVLGCSVREIPAAQRHGIVPIGRPFAQVECRVVDPAGRLLPFGVPGELWIGGPSVARGYLNLSDGRFADGLYHSGDRVRVSSAGLIEFLGRVDDQVKIRGFRVELNEVAAALRGLDEVGEAIVLPVGEAHTRRLAAWVTPSTVDVARVRAALREGLPDYMVPSAIVALDSLPLNANGKVDRAALPAPEPPQAADRVAPQTPAQLKVAAAWAGVLGLDELGIDDDFFALGGDSFKAVRAVRAIDPDLRVIDLFTRPTIRELASYLEGDSTSGGLLHRLAGSAGATLNVVCVPYGGGSAAAYGPLATELARRLPGSAVHAIELPGHDPARPDEPPLPLAEVVSRVMAELPEGPTLVYGHCVGSALATELSQRLELEGRPLAGLVIGGSFPAARLPGRIATWAHQRFGATRWTTDRAYKDFLRTLGGLDDELDAGVILRGLRHDVNEAQAWFSQELIRADRRKLRAPVLCVIGGRDRSTELYEERYAEWGAFAERVELAVVPKAGHYFLKHQAEWVAERISSALAGWGAGEIPEKIDASGTVGKRARRNLREFYVVAAGQTTGLVGAALSSFALGVWAYQQSNRVSDYALVTMLALLPSILALPLGGALADRVDRRRIMLACNAIGAAIMSVIVLLLALDQLVIWNVGLLVGLISLVTAFHRPAYLAAVAQLVPKPYLAQANALANLGPGLGMLIAPLAGGALITTLGLPWVVAIDVTSLVIGLATLLFVRLPDRLFRKRDESFGQALVGGWRFLVRRKPMMAMVYFFVVENYLGMLALAVTVPTVYAYGEATAVSVVSALGGVGAGLGALVMVLWGGTSRRATGMVGFVSGVGVGALLVGVVPSLWLAALGSLIWYASLSILNAHWLAIIQVKVGLDLQGRVLAANQMLALAMTPAAFLTAPLLTEWVGGTGRLLVISGGLLAVWGVLGLLYRPLHRMEDALPDAVAGAEIADSLDEVQAAADLTPTR